MNKKEFWDKVEKCEHKNLSEYSRYIPCGTPYCGGSEDHCLGCGVYITKCGCGFNNGMSGWPMKRWTRHESENFSNY